MTATAEDRGQIKVIRAELEGRPIRKLLVLWYVIFIRLYNKLLSRFVPSFAALAAQIESNGSGVQVLQRQGIGEWTAVDRIPHTWTFEIGHSRPSSIAQRERGESDCDVIASSCLLLFQYYYFDCSFTPLRLIIRLLPASSGSQARSNRFPTLIQFLCRAIHHRLATCLNQNIDCVTMTEYYITLHSTAHSRFSFFGPTFLPAYFSTNCYSSSSQAKIVLLGGMKGKKGKVHQKSSSSIGLIDRYPFLARQQQRSSGDNYHRACRRGRKCSFPIAKYNNDLLSVS